MGRSQKWPDLRSPISKIQDIRFVGTDDLIIFRKFHNFPWNIVAVARWKSHFVVGSLDLTWWPDLTWPWAEIFTKVAEKMGVSWVKTRRRCALPFFRYPRKTWGGGGVQTPPPPAGRGLRNYCLLRYISCIFGFGNDYNITFILNFKWCALPHVFVAVVQQRFVSLQYWNDDDYIIMIIILLYYYDDYYIAILQRSRKSNNILLNIT